MECIHTMLIVILYTPQQCGVWSVQYGVYTLLCYNSDLIPQQIVHIMMSRIGANMEVAPRLFDLQLQHLYSAEAYWLMPGASITDIISGYTSRHPPNEWK